MLAALGIEKHTDDARIRELAVPTGPRLSRLVPRFRPATR